MEEEESAVLNEALRTTADHLRIMARATEDVASAVNKSSMFRGKLSVEMRIPFGPRTAIDYAVQASQSDLHQVTKNPEIHFSVELIRWIPGMLHRDCHMIEVPDHETAMKIITKARQHDFGPMPYKDAEAIFKRIAEEEER